MLDHAKMYAFKITHQIDVAYIYFATSRYYFFSINNHQTFSLGLWLSVSVVGAASVLISLAFC
jgi:hypothetical protein